MTQDWQIDLELIAQIRALEALRAKLHLALKNGPRSDFYEAWTKIHELSREAGWRLHHLAYIERNPPPAPVPKVELEEVE